MLFLLGDFVSMHLCFWRELFLFDVLLCSLKDDSNTSISFSLQRALDNRFGFCFFYPYDEGCFLSFKRSFDWLLVAVSGNGEFKSHSSLEGILALQNYFFSEKQIVITLLSSVPQKRLPL